MIRPIQYFGGDADPAIAQFSQQFQKGDNTAIALNILQHINYESCQSLIAYLVQP